MPRIPYAQIIRDPRDATRDYFIPAADAQQLARQGKLVYDSTNSTYCLPGSWATSRAAPIIHLGTFHR